MPSTGNRTTMLPNDAISCSLSGRPSSVPFSMSVSLRKGGTHSCRRPRSRRIFGSFERLAQAALGFAGINIARTAGGLQQLQLVEEALALAPPGDSALKARMLARLAVDYRVAPTMSDRIAPLSDEAIAMARRLGDHSVLAFTLVTRHSAIWGPDNLDERLSVAEEGWRAAEAAGDLLNAMWSQLFFCTSLYEAGDCDGVDRATAAYADSARRSGMPYFQWVADLWMVARNIREGHLADADVNVPMLGGDSPALVAVYFRTLLLFLLRREQGRWDDLDASLLSVIALAESTTGAFDQHRAHICRVVRMLLLIDSDRQHEAHAEYQMFVSRTLDRLPKDGYWLTTVALLGEVSSALDDRHIAARIYDLLTPYGSRNVAPASSPISFGPVSFYLGLLATLLNRLDEAERHFEAAMEMNARMRARPALSRTQLGFSRMLLKRATPDAHGRATAMLEQIIVQADELGLTRLADQARGLLATATVPAPPVRFGTPHGLSAREMDVLRLIVAGRTDREIAEELFISKRTVTTHVSNIFNKLGLSTRAEAAAFAVRHELD